MSAYPALQAQPGATTDASAPPMPEGDSSYAAPGAAYADPIRYEAPPGPITHEEKDDDDYVMGEGYTTGGGVEDEIAFGGYEGRIVPPSAQKIEPSLIPVPASEFNAEKRAEEIANVFGKWFRKSATVQKTLLEQLTGLSSHQRVAVTLAYNAKNKKKLDSVIKKSCDGALRELLLAMCVPIPEYNAHWFQLALKKKDITMLTTIMCTMSTQELQLAHAAYNEMFPKKPLLKAIEKQTGSWFKTRNVQQFFKNILEHPRPRDTDPVMADVVNQDARTIVEAMKGRRPDKEKLVDIFTKRSHEHIAAVYTEFKKVAGGKDLIRVISDSFKESSETGYACNITVYYAARRNELFVDLLLKAIRRDTKNHDFLTRIILSRCESDFGTIRDGFGFDTLRRLMDEEFQDKDKDQVYYSVLRQLAGYTGAFIQSIVS